MPVAFLGALSQGVIWGLMALGVYITYKLLDIADLTVDGSFTTGGAVCAVAIVVFGINPAWALLLGFAAGAVAGLVTGLLATFFQIPPILAGILTQIGLWSVNLRIMGKPNVPVLTEETVFSLASEAWGLDQSVVTIIVGTAIAALVIGVLYWFFGTEVGSALRATGNNEDMIRALGANTKIAKVIGLMLSNGLVGLSGALICQSQRFADISMGQGAIVVGLASIVIGEVLGRLTPGKLTGFLSRLVAAVAGAVVYYLIRAYVLQLGLDGNDMKLVSAIIVALSLSLPVLLDRGRRFLERSRRHKAYAEGGER